MADRGGRTLSDADIERLADLPEARLTWLRRVNLDRRGFTGNWQNVSFGVMISAVGDAGFLFEAAIVDPLQSALTRETSLGFRQKEPTTEP